MDSGLSLRQKRADAIESARRLLHDRDSLDDEQSGKYEALLVEIRAYGDQIRRKEALDAESAVGGAVETRRVPPDDPSSVVDSSVVVRPAEDTAPIEFRFGRFLQRVHSVDALRDERALSEIRSATGAGQAVGADGGFLVQTDFSQEIFRRMNQMGQLLQRARRLTISANSNSLEIPVVDETSRATGSRWGGVQGYWLDEGSAITASRPRLSKVSLKLNKLSALGYATDELLQDAQALGMIMLEAFSEELMFLAEDAIVNGSGSGQPMGLLNASAVVSVSKETNQAASTLVYNNIIKMYSRLYGRSRPNSVWFVNQDIEPQLFSLSLAVGTGGAPAYLPANGLSGSPFATLMGRPVVPVEYCATLGTVGDIILADLSQYVFVDKGAPEGAQSIHLKFDQVETAFRLVYRCDGEPLWRSALTPFKGSNTQSPYVSLATRS